MTLLADQFFRQVAANRVGIAEFCESSDFCGYRLFPRQQVLLKLFFLEEMEGWEEDVLSEWIRGEGGVGISPKVRDRRDYLRANGYTHFSEIQLIGGRRGGKGFMTALAMAKIMHEVQQIPNPGEHFNISKDKEIYFSCVAASLDQAKKFQFADLINVVSNCRPLLPYVTNIMEEGFNITTDADAEVVAALRAAGVSVSRDYCLAGNTSVYVRTPARGTRSIVLSKIVSNIGKTPVEVWNGEKWTHVVAARKSTQTEGLQLTLRNGEKLHCTDNHRWPTERGLLSASELLVGDVIESTELPDNAGDIKHLPDDDIGWLCGLYLAEGSGVHSDSYGTVAFAGHIDEVSRFERIKRIAADFDGTATVRSQSENGVSIDLYSPVLKAVIARYIGGNDAKSKRVKTAAMNRSNAFLTSLMDGYLEGDGSRIKSCTNQFAIGFTRNVALARCLRTICARLGYSVRIRPHVCVLGDKQHPGFRGTLSMPPGKRITKDFEIVSIVKSAASAFWDIEVEDEPHLFALGSGVLTHNSKLRAKPLPANARSVRGATSLVLAFDEMAHMMEGKSSSTGSEVYHAAEPSMAQFGKAALMFLNSSPWAKTGKFYEQCEIGFRLDEEGNPFSHSMLSFQWPSWALYSGYDKDPRKQRYGHAKIPNAVMANPDLPDEEQGCEDDRLSAREERLKEKASPEVYRVERRAQWAEVLDGYLDPTMVDRAFSGVIHIPAASVASLKEDIFQPVRMPTSGSYNHNFMCHLDPSSTTAGFGFAMGHVEAFPNPNFNGEPVNHVIIDWIKRWNPEDFPQGTIDYMVVMREVLHIIDLFRPSELTFDQFDSAMPIQWLREEMARMKIYETKVFKSQGNNKENWNKWQTLKTAMNLGMIHIAPDCPDSDYAKQEFKFLSCDMRKQNPTVDRQTTGPITTKDMVDSARDVCYKFLGSFLSDLIGVRGNTPIRTGAQGGYPMGGRSAHGPVSQPGNAFDQFYRNKGSASGAMNPARGIRRGR